MDVWRCVLAGLTTLLMSCGDHETVTMDTSAPLEEDYPVSAAENPKPIWDGERTEVFQDAALAHLKEVIKHLEAGKADPAIDQCQATELRPAVAEGSSVFERDGLQVLRWQDGSSEFSLSHAFAAIKRAWPTDAKPRLKVKFFGVQVTGEDEAHTRTAFHAYASGATLSVQQQAEWRCVWNEIDQATPMLARIELVDLEEIRSEQGGGLVDVTLPLLGALPAFQKKLQFGANHWITRRPRLKHRFQHGVAVGDVDGNGLEDVYLCQPEGMANVLLLRQADGSVTEGAADFGLDFRDITTSAILADFDNDGDQDLAAAFRSPFDLFENVDGRFERRFSLPHLGQIFNLAAADYDNDGLLDLFVCRYENYANDGRSRNAIPLHDARNGGENALLRNLGDWKFADVTQTVGLDQNNDRWSTAASWEDFDRDGDLDLYVSNDYGRNNLYRCDSSGHQVRFTDIAAEVGVEDMTTSMGACWGDPNRDGRPDIYVSNMYSSAGRRITFAQNFKRNIPGADSSHVQAWQNASMGNSLFQSNPNGSFTHTSEQARIQNGQWSWGTLFADLNHDGWEDLLVANGFISGPSSAPDL